MVPIAHTLYSDSLNELYVGSRNLSWTEAELQVLNSEISHFKNIVVEIFAKHSSTGFLT